MMLGYDARQATKDVHAVIPPGKEGLKLAAKVGKELGLPEGWLNDHVKAFLAPSGQTRKLPFEFPGLQITAPTAGYLLTMKVLACRQPLPGFQGDLEDLRFLIQTMNIKSIGEIQKHINKYFPDDAMIPAHRAIIQNLIKDEP